MWMSGKKKKVRESSASGALSPRMTDKKVFFIILLFLGKCKNPAESGKNSLTKDLSDFYGLAMTVYCKYVT